MTVGNSIGSVVLVELTFSRRLVPIRFWAISGEMALLTTTEAETFFHASIPFLFRQFLDLDISNLHRCWT